MYTLNLVLFSIETQSRVMIRFKAEEALRMVSDAVRVGCFILYLNITNYNPGKVPSS